MLAVGASAWFDAPSHQAGAHLAARVIDLAERLGTPVPDLNLRSTGIQIRICSRGGGFGSADVEMARAISAAAAETGLGADPAVGQDVQLTFDTLNAESITPL